MAETQILVSNSEDLYQALSTVSGGETILLASGDYGDLSLWSGSGFDVQFDSMVTIKSADVDDPAVFSEVELRTVSNLTFDNVVIDYDISDGDPTYAKAFEVRDSANITIVNSVFAGDLASGVSAEHDGFGYGFGLSVRGSSGIVVENNEFYDWFRAAVFGNTDDLVVSGNEVHNVSSDGFDFAAVTGALIEDNYFHDFNKSDLSGAHMDMIQFWTSGTDTPSTDIIIRGNILDIGDGVATQSIFMRNEKVDSYGAGQEMFYQNVLIEENTIYNGHIHGVTIGETNGLIIRNNTLVEAEGGQPLVDGNSSIPSINIASDSTSVQIVQNAVFAIAGYTDQADWVLQKNAFIQNNDPDLPGYYRDVFVSSSLDASSGRHNFVATPGEMLDVLNAGSSAIDFIEAPSELTAMFNVKSHTDEGLVFDSSLSHNTAGKTSLQDAKFTWDFGDGSTADGLLVNHVYAKPGYYDVNLIVTMPDSSSSAEHLRVGVAGDEILKFDSGSGSFSSLAYGASTDSKAALKNLIVRENGAVFVMSGTGVQATVEHEAFTRLFGADNFDLSLSLTATNGSNSAGELFRVHGHFLSSINSDGSLTFIMGADDGSKVKISTTGVNLVDGQTHDLEFIFDGESNAVGIWIDGALNATGKITGNIGGSARDLTFGDPWGGDAFDGEISNFNLSSQRNDYSVFEGAETELQSSTVATEADAIAPAIDVNAPEVDTVTPDADTTTPEVDTPSESEPLPEEDSGTLEPLHRWGYEMDSALQLGAEGIKASVAAPELSGLYDTDAFEISMTLKADSATSWGEIARIHNNFITSVDRNGNFRLELFLDNGSHVNMVSKGLSLNDGALHDVIVRFDGEAGFTKILVDGQVVASESVSGSISDGARSLTFGNPWGKQNFDGELSAFALSADSIDFPADDGLADLISDTPTAALDTTPEVDTPSESEPLPEEDSESPEPLLRGGYEMDIADIGNSETVKLYDDAHIVDTQDGSTLLFDGDKDFASLGRLREFEASQKIAFSVDFTKNDADGSGERLVWNHLKVGLTLEGDGIRVHATNNDASFGKGFQIDGLGLNDGQQHSTTVMVDSKTDRLQVVVDDVLVLDEQDTDFDFVGAGGSEWGWSLGGGWSRWFEGSVHNFQVSDDFDFVEQPPADEGLILS